MTGGKTSFRFSDREGYHKPEKLANPIGKLGHLVRTSPVQWRGAEAKRAHLVRPNLFPLSCAGVEAA